MHDLIKINNATKLYCDWIKYWSGMWAYMQYIHGELRSVRQDVCNLKQEMQRNREIYYSTNGG